MTGRLAFIDVYFLQSLPLMDQSSLPAESFPKDKSDNNAIRR
jgi:hypothetical protein